ncbi:MAG: YciI family protein [Polyangiaceae bacterium]
MKFMIMHKNDPKTEAGELPPMELVAKMGEFIGEFASTGRFLDGAGLAGSKTRTRLVFRGGQCTKKQGPYQGEHELPSATLLLKVKTREEALGWAERYGKILGDGELEIGKVNEPWDLGVMPAPENPPLQFLLIDKADAATEAGGRSPKLKSELTRLKTEMTKAGVLQRTVNLRPSSSAKRLFFRNNDLRIQDGPFAESKELLGGFVVMELADMDEVIAMTKRYAAILGGTLEVDVRSVDTDAEGSDADADK